MPIDLPKVGETEEQYLQYCIPAEIEAGKAQDVAAAICISTYRQDKMSYIRDASKKAMARIAYDTDFRGIDLTKLAEGEGLENACLDGVRGNRN